MPEHDSAGNEQCPWRPSRGSDPAGGGRRGAGYLWLSLWNSALARGALLALATVLCYLPAAHCGYIWDDEAYVTENPLLTAPDGLWRIWFSFDSPSQYFPLVYSTLRLEYSAWGLAPLGYHLVNIALHAFNALLLWRLLARLKMPGAWLAAALFALHPVQVESVAWVTELKNVEMGFFFLLSLHAWAAFRERSVEALPSSHRQEVRRWGCYALSLLFYTLALFSKTTACTLPAALLIILWWQGERIRWRRLAEVFPYMVLGLGMGLLTVWWERHHQGTHGTMFTMSPAQRVLIASRGVWFYLEKLVWPTNLTFSYPRWSLSAADPVSYFWLLSLCGLGAATFFGRRRLGRAPFVALVYFVATLGPILGILMLYTFRYTYVADHYQYLACIGPLALFSGSVATLRARHPTWSIGCGLGAGLLLLALGALTWNQCHAYRDDESIWRDTIRKNPASLIAHFNLADILKRNGNSAASLEQYNRAIAIDPTSVEAWCERGNLLAEGGRLREAAEDYQTALKVDPNSAPVRKGYGIILEKGGAPAEAIAQFREAARLDPHYLPARKLLADLLASQGDFAGALPYYEELAHIFPTVPGARACLARTDASLGKVADAIHEYREAIRLAPGWAEAMTRLAWLLATSDDLNMRNSAEAISLAQRACALTRNENAVTLQTLAAAYAADGRFADASAAIRLAIEAALKAGDRQSADSFRADAGRYEQQAATAADELPKK